MTHLALAHLSLPKWLDEGIAVNLERRLTGLRDSLYTPKELHEKHLEFWNEQSIQEFWSGTSFQRTDAGNLLSYEQCHAGLMLREHAEEDPDDAAHLRHISE